ncbi:MAG: hypothetical protein JNL38_37840 [Myxococcales bacterium]|nr:hypothetical protein [Myxococcales bacterium]
MARPDADGSGSIGLRMHLVDVLALVVLVIGAVAFVLGGLALARSADLEALYWLVVGVVGVRASVQMVRPAKG